jgi:hypothetical protein
VAFLKLFEKIYAPLTAGLLKPLRGDCMLAEEKRCELDRLYQIVCDDWMRFCERSRSGSPRELPQREQNSCCGPDNGN